VPILSLLKSFFNLKPDAMNARKIALFFVLIIASSALYAQTGVLKGVITDTRTQETLIGANITYAPGKGVVTNIDGEYELELPYGDYTLTISYVGFESRTKKVQINQPEQILDFNLSYITLTAVEVVGDMAKTRETPVAFSTIEPKKMEEELASQDIPLILNATPGVYATQQGGGDGDARINIRGFNQRNVAVMLDGIPVNDMENGWVYWSNWFGLDLVMQRTQVIRGLGKSKLAIPSVGGTINLQTKGIGAKRQLKLKQEVGGDGFLRTSLGLTSGKLGNGWGITAAGSYKRGNGWVDQTWTEGWFYFLRVDKDLGRHHLSFKAMGAPQQHGQRSYKKSIAQFDTAYAIDHGVPKEDFLPEIPLNQGLRFNANWGWLDRYTLDADGNEVSNGREALNEKKNYYHKPMFSISDFWNVNDNLYLSNIVYLSIGDGGGTGITNSTSTTSDGLVDFQKMYDANYNGMFNPDRRSTGILHSSMNNHFWYGLLSTFTLSLNEFWTLSGGLDLRDYKGEHYREVYDLLGGDYYDLDNQNQNEASDQEHRVGDIISFHNDGLVRWGGIFGQIEYSKDKLTAFLNLTTSYSGYKRIDYFKPKMLTVGDTLLRIAYDTKIEYNGTIYDRNSQGLEDAHTDWKWIAGGTIKGGANYNINDNMNVFVNMGYLSKAPRFNNIYDYNNVLYREIKNENITAFELGYSYYNPKMTFNLNGYYTIWQNKPADYAPTIMIDDEPHKVNINGMDAVHMGVEMEFAYQLTKNLKFEALLSVGDWKWNSADSARIYDDNQNLVETRFFDAKGIYVGDAAQIQNRESIRWEVIDDLYLKGSFTYFGKNYSNFDPLNLDPVTNPWAFENGKPRQSWKIPDYYLIDMHVGYGFNVKKTRFDVRASVLNLLDEVYISDADNNDSYTGQSFNDFDARSAAVFFGMGRRWNLSLQMTF